MKMRSIKESLKSMRRNKGISFASIFVVSLTLLLLGVFLVLGIFSTQATNGFVDTLKVVVYLEKDITDTQIIEIEAAINSVPNVMATEFSSKENELQYISEAYGDSAYLVEEFFGASNPLNDVILVEVSNAIDNLSIVATEIDVLPNVEKTDYGSASIDSFISAIQQGQVYMVVFFLIFLVISIFMISLTISLAIEHRKPEVGIMKLVGAKNSYIRAPFLTEGILIGFFASLIPIGIVIFIYNQIYNFFTSFRDVLFTVETMSLVISAILIFTGAIVGLIGSYNAVRKSLKDKKPIKFKIK